MSSNSYDVDCWKCNGKNSMMMTENNRPPSLNGECIECGYSIWTVNGYMEIDEVNEIREGLDLQPLKKLEKKRGI